MVTTVWFSHLEVTRLFSTSCRERLDLLVREFGSLPWSTTKLECRLISRQTKYNHHFGSSKFGSQSIDNRRNEDGHWSVVRAPSRPQVERDCSYRPHKSFSSDPTGNAGELKPGISDPFSNPFCLLDVLTRVRDGLNPVKVSVLTSFTVDHCLCILFILFILFIILIFGRSETGTYIQIILLSIGINSWYTSMTRFSECKVSSLGWLLGYSVYHKNNNNNK